MTPNSSSSSSGSTATSGTKPSTASLTLGLCQWTYPQYPRATRAWHWSRSVLVAVLTVTLFSLLALVAVQAVEWLTASLGRGGRSSPDWAQPLFSNTLLFDVLLAHVALILLIPACLLATRWGFRYNGLLWSVAGRVRWGWLFQCMAVALIGSVLAAVLDMGLGNVAAHWQPESAAWAFVLIALLLTPLQALAEELVFRGVLFQVVGSWFAHPLASLIVATTITSLLFALIHGQQSPAVFLDRLLMGVMLCWLAYKTQGLEASIAIHTANNQVLFLLATLTGTLEDALATTTASWLEVAVHMVCVLVVVLILWWQYTRRNNTT